MKVNVFTLAFLVVSLLAIAHDLAPFHERADVKYPLYALTALSLLGVALLIVHRKGLAHGVLGLRANGLLISYVALLLAIQLLHHHLSTERTIRLLGYVFVSALTYAFIAYYLSEDRSMFYCWVGVCAAMSAFLSFTAIVSCLPVNSFLGIPFSVKEHAAYQIFGIYATGGVTAHPLTLGSQTFFGVCCAGLMWRRRRRWGTLVLLGLSLVGLILSMSRGAWLATAVAGFYWLLPRPLTRYRLAIFFVLPGILTAAMLAFIGLARKHPLLVQTLRLDMGMSNREILWPLGWDLIQQNPWTGYGFLSSGDLLSQSGVAWALGLREDAPFHNTFIDMALFSGVIVAGLYILLFLYPAFRVLRCPAATREDRDLQKFLLCMCLGITVTSFFQNYNIGGVRLPSISLALFLGTTHWFGRSLPKPGEAAG